MAAAVESELVGEEVCDSAVKYVGSRNGCPFYVLMKELIIPEGHSPVSVDVICPTCSKKAYLRGSVVQLYKRSYRSVKGVVSCAHCGLIREGITMNCTDFWYQVPVGDRVLYAVDRENLIGIKAYFKSRMRWDDDPDLDFPKEFYLCRDELVEKVERLLAKEDAVK